MKIKDTTVDLVQNQVYIPDKPALKKGVTYTLTVADACIVDQTLKVCFEISDDKQHEVFYVLETFQLGSSKYFDFVHTIYVGDDSPVISVKLSDFDRFYADCTADSLKDGHLCLNKIDIWGSPLCTNWSSHHKND